MSVHIHDLDPSCREHRMQDGSLRGECMKPRVRRWRNWWRVYYPGRAWSVLVHQTWEAALDQANRSARKASR